MKYHAYRDPTIASGDWEWCVQDENGEIVDRGYLTREAAEYWAVDWELQDVEREREALAERLAQMALKRKGL